MWGVGFIVAGSSLIASISNAADGGAFHVPSFSPDVAIQAGISNFIATARSAELNDEEQFFAAMDDFFDKNGTSEEEDLIQLLLIYGGEEEHKTNPQSEMLKRVMVFHLAGSMDKEKLVASLAPLLDETEEPKLLKKL